MMSNDTPAADGQLLYKIGDACKILAMSRSSVYRELSAGRIVALRIGGKRRITREALVAYTQSAAHERDEK